MEHPEPESQNRAVDTQCARACARRGLFGAYPSRYRRAKPLSGGYREELTAALREPEVVSENATGPINNNVTVTFFTTSRCSCEPTAFNRRRSARSGLHTRRTCRR